MRVLRYIWQLLREIADENAYARYLTGNGLRHSAETWRRFSDLKFRNRFEKPKCC
jgi:hypothetical protein